VRELAEGGRQNRVEFSTLSGDFDAAALTAQQWPTDKALKALDLPADSPGRDIQLGRSPRHAAVARHRFEGGERRQ